MTSVLVPLVAAVLAVVNPPGDGRSTLSRWWDSVIAWAEDVPDGYKIAGAVAFGVIAVFGVVKRLVALVLITGVLGAGLAIWWIVGRPTPT